MKLISIPDLSSTIDVHGPCMAHEWLNWGACGHVVYRVAILLFLPYFLFIQLVLFLSYLHALWDFLDLTAKTLCFFLLLYWKGRVNKYEEGRLINHFKYIFSFLGSVMPIDEIVVWSHDVGAKVLVDACQSVPHMVVDVQKLDADFVVASSHKVFIMFRIHENTMEFSFSLKRLLIGCSGMIVSDVWTYRHWILIWKKTNSVGNGSFGWAYKLYMLHTRSDLFLYMLLVYALMQFLVLPCSSGRWQRNDC